MPSAFEDQEKRRLKEELASFNHHLDEDTEREKQRHKRNLEALNKRKEDMMKERKQKLQVCV